MLCLCHWWKEEERKSQMCTFVSSEMKYVNHMPQVKQWRAVIWIIMVTT